MRRREDGTELDAPVPVLPIPLCTALDSQDFIACAPFVARATAHCCFKSWPPNPPPPREGLAHAVVNYYVELFVAVSERKGLVLQTDVRFFFKDWSRTSEDVS